MTCSYIVALFIELHCSSGV